MKISVGNSCTSRAWKIKEFSWEKFVQKCSQTIRTAETVQEYRKLPKGQQDNIKDVGGFVGGELRSGLRRKDTVINRCLLTLDADYADEDFWEQIANTPGPTCAPMVGPTEIASSIVQA